MWKNGKIKKDYNQKISIEKIKEFIIERIYKYLPKDSADFCLALSIGYKTGLSKEVTENFRTNNLAHMLAISGLHVSYLIFIINTLLKPIRTNAKFILIMFFLLFFMQLVGNTASVNRACIVVILNLFASVIYRKSDQVTNLAISAGIILLINPYSIMDLSFIYSYIGTIGIIIMYPILKSKTEIFIIKCVRINNNYLQENYGLIKKIFMKFTKYIIEMLLISISVNTILMPIIIYNNNNIPLVFIFSNLIISPILILCIIFSMIIVIIYVVPLNIYCIINKFYSFLVNIIIIVTKYFSNLSVLDVIVVTPSIFSVLLAYFFITLFIYLEKNEQVKKQIFYYIKKYFSLKKVFVLISCVIILFSFLKFRKRELKVYFVDVGQGDCTLIVTPNNKKILIDGGGSLSEEYDIGKSILQPYLLDRKIKTIDFLIISHFDFDHVRSVYFTL
jgi:competence protein ComEC